MAFAVAMNEWLTVTTSSPGPTPDAASARCSAVVQLDTAHAWVAPTAVANSRSNAATSGPCVIQPERMDRRAASASRSSIQVRAIGIITAGTVISTRRRLGLDRGNAPVVDDLLLQQVLRRYRL